jgi:hypothetical protein
VLCVTKVMVIVPVVLLALVVALRTADAQAQWVDGASWRCRLRRERETLHVAARTGERKLELVIADTGPASMPRIVPRPR